jgi:hypothetical protein
MGAAALEEMAVAVNAHHLDPPLALAEVRAVIASVVHRYVPGSASDFDALVARALRS